MIVRDCILDLENSVDLEPDALTLYDLSRYHSHGTMVGAGRPNAVQLPNGLWVWDFNAATTDYITIPAAHTQLDSTSEDFSIIARIYIDSLVTGRMVWCRGLMNTDGYFFLPESNGALRFVTCQAAAAQTTLSAAGDLVINTWFTIGVSRNGASARLYRNGVDVTAAPAVHIDPLTSARIGRIGIYDNLASNPYDGKIAFLRIYNYALTAGQHLIEHEKVKHWFGVHN